jgi:hypothetical protein
MTSPAVLSIELSRHFGKTPMSVKKSQTDTGDPFSHPGEVAYRRLNRYLREARPQMVSPLLAYLSTSTHFWCANPRECSSRGAEVKQ